MEVPNEEGEMAMPINSAYGHGHMIHHDPAPQNNHIIPSSQIITSKNGPPISSNKKMMKYKECLENHAAAMGGNATDGCGEFMPSGEEGTFEFLTCSVCNCHRNFHRKETEGELVRKVYVGHPHKAFVYPASRAAPHQMIMSYNNHMGSIPGINQEDGIINGGCGVMARPLNYQQLVKKRFRTKFSQEQKEKMLNFAEKIGWKMQKQEEAMVQQFCQQVGVKRRLLKVWMHNLAKKNSNDINTESQV
ncbi:zinc-finger homeodomain protein 4-like isoform X1 [Nicotiana tabacum]|uniref:Zinc-finger homeodomain protein 4-like n=2 Tax=Nicotiana TaxID=4085 RepID=A0A1S3XCV1_TOBAC|nr:PREDICTED: zinc-finger homeodomain protein 4-like isoform X1 [Nicotiana sylvestris]XP_016437760.1 PREDICTED: zinc-finger homeodomain protein 4-like [Nicotiana tabacum]